MKSSGLSSAFGGNLAIMDIYAAQKMFGRGRTFDRIDLGTEARTDDCPCSAGAQPAARAGPSNRAAVGPRPAVRGHAGGLFDDGEHLEPVRAVHRDVHHLQLVCDCGDPAPIRNRHSPRPRRHAAPDSHAVSRRKRRDRARRVARRPGVRPADRARHRGVHRH